MPINRILVADDEESIRWVLSKSLGKKGFTVDLASNGSEALELSRRYQHDLAVLDIKMPGINGLDLLTTLQNERPGMPVVIMTAESSMKNAIEAMKRGAYDYLPKPFDLDLLEAIVLRAQKAIITTDEVHRLKGELRERQRSERPLIGNGKAMQELFKLIGRIAPSDATILITGESGTGKELVARAIHANSNRLDNPFIALNCAAIPRELLESELFGHEKGSFTGAHERKAGKFEQANGGTIFLDEIGDMALDLQAKLLRVLQEKEVTRTGGSATIRIDVRIIAATNMNLEEKVAAREFREDLFYRLNVVPIHLPPLRERKEDIPLLVDFFLGRARSEFGVSTSSCDESALKLLKRHDWPGNVRELENTIQRASILSPDPILTVSDFPQLNKGSSTASNRGDSLETLIANKLRISLGQMEVNELNNLYDMVLHQMERPLLTLILKTTRWNQVRAAEILGINRNTLRKKIQTLGITPKKGE
jgi:two-component system nitrogen regulation response regulator GlnG